MDARALQQAIESLSHSHRGPRATKCAATASSVAIKKEVQELDCGELLGKGERRSV